MGNAGWLSGRSSVSQSPARVTWCWGGSCTATPGRQCNCHPTGLVVDARETEELSTLVGQLAAGYTDRG